MLHFAMARTTTLTMRLLAASWVFLLFPALCSASKHAPTGVLLALGTGQDAMVVTYSTRKPTEFTNVEYWSIDGGGGNVTLLANGTQHEFVDGGPAKSVRYIHTTELTALAPGQKYFYRVGDGEAHWSVPFFFFAKRSPEQVAAGPPLRMIAICDVGVEESAGLLKLIEAELHGVPATMTAMARREGGGGAGGDLASSHSDEDAFASFHPDGVFPDVLMQCGDFAYDLDTDDGKRGDLFLELIQPIAAYVPYMARGMGRTLALSLPFSSLGDPRLALLWVLPKIYNAIFWQKCR